MSGAPTSELLGEVTVLDDVGPARRGRAYPAVGTSSLLLLPAAVLLGGLVLWPVLRALAASVTDPVDGGFAGLAYFRAAMSTEDAWAVVGRTLLWALVVPAVVTSLGYALAAVSRRSRTGRVTRLILVAPIAVPLVVTAVVFRLMFHPDPERGFVTWVFGRVLGTPPVLLGPRLVTVSLMTAFVWAWVGLAVVVFRKALDDVPPDLADAVRAHGGTRRDVFRDAQWRPLLRRTVAVVFALVALGTARTFDLILVMAPGSVVDEASVLAVRVWQTSGGSTGGPGAALGVVWLAVVAVGVAVAAFGVRQPWPPPPPSGRTDPTPDTPRTLRVARRIVLSLAAVTWVLPLAILVATSLRAPWDAATGGLAWWRAAVRPDSYAGLLDGDLGRSLGFTLLLATVVTAVVLGVAACTAYPLAWLSGPGGQVAGVLLLAAAVVPIQVIAGPVTEVLGSIGLAGSAPGLALVHVALGLPFAVLVLRNALGDLPAEEVRRVRLSGRWRWAPMWRLARAVRPAVVAVCVLEFVQVWNDLVVGLLFSAPDGVPVGLLLYGQTRHFVANSGPLAASSVIVSVLPVLLIILARRLLVTGLVSGAIR